MTTIYPAIADALLPVLPSFTIAGPSFTVTRTTPGTPAAAATTASAGSVTLYIVPAKVLGMTGAEPGTPIPISDYYAFGATSASVRQGDVLDDGTSAFVITGAPNIDLGLLIAPVERTARP